MSDTAVNQKINDQTINADEPSRPQVSVPAPALGAQLAALREARGWSVEQVATQLNLAPRQIQAIELDNYDALPGMASVRGFIRAYAKLLKIDATPLLSMISSQSATPGEPLQLRRALTSEPFSDNRSLSYSRTSLLSKITIVSLIIIVVLGIVFVGEQLGWLSSMQQPLDLAMKGLSSAPNNDAGGLASSKVPTIPAGVAAVSEPVMVNATPAESVASLPRTELVATPGESETKATTAGDLLVLELSQDSWVEIKQANNHVLVSRLLKAGSSESFEMTEPVSMTLGNAAGVNVSLRGAPVDVKSAGKNNVVHLNLK
jgi:cytoskeleton protein RodZ